MPKNMIADLRKLYWAGVAAGFQEAHSWLSGMTASQAFVVCVGAGPWKLPRRQIIQLQALRVLGANGLQDVCPVYPLDWQNKMAKSVHHYLSTNHITMEDLCAQARSGKDRRVIYRAAGVPKGTKVLSLFCRDFLRVPAFPIDRHVKRVLQARGLPTHEDQMIQLCVDAEIDPNILATIAVRVGSNDTQGTLNAANLLGMI